MVRSSGTACLLAVALAACPRAPEPVTPAPVATPPDAGAAPVAPAPVRKPGIASIGGTATDAVGTRVPGEAVLARRTRRTLPPNPLPACAPPQVIDAASVVALGFEVLERAPLRTDGRFLFNGLGEGDYVVWVEGEGLRTASYPVHAAYLHQELGALELAPRRTLALKVESPDGKPVEGAQVLAADAAGVLAAAVTGADGLATLPGLPRAGVLAVASSPATFSASVDLHDGATAAALTLPPREDKDVLVTESGAPIPGVTVQVRSAGPGRCEAVTDSLGLAHFAGLAIDGLVASAAAGGKSASARLGPAQRTELALSDARRVKLSVLDTAGAPLVAEVVHPSFDGTRRASTDPDGTLSLDGVRLPEGTPALVLEVSAPGKTPVAVTVATGPATNPATLVVKLESTLPVDCMVLDDPTARPGTLQVFLAPVSGPGLMRRALHHEASTWFDDEVPRGRWRCEAERDGAVVATSREFDHPQSPSGSAVRVTVPVR